MSRTTPKYTTAEVAELLDRHPSNISRRARTLGIGRRRAGAWFFSDADIARLRIEVARPAGRPPRVTEASPSRSGATVHGATRDDTVASHDP